MASRTGIRRLVYRAGTLTVAAFLAGVSACQSAPAPASHAVTGIGDLSPVTGTNDEPVRVLASTSIVAEVAGNVGQELAIVEPLIGPGSDPHAAVFSPGDLQALQRADVVLLSGLGLEDELLAALSPVDLQAPVISISEGIQPHSLPAQGARAGRADPHVWLDPTNVMVWVRNITTAFSRLDPPNAGQYSSNAQLYLAELEELDHAIANAVSAIPPERRTLVTDHAALQHFAVRYEFTVLGSVLQADSTQAEPSPRQLAELQRSIEKHEVPAMFVSAGVRRTLIDQLAGDMEIAVYTLYLDSLTPPDGPAATYLDLMMYNARTIQSGLSSDE